jgi:hypothetical protein
LLKNGIITSTVDYPLLSEINNYSASTFSREFYNASKIASNILTFPTHPDVKMLDYTNLFDELFKILSKREEAKSHMKNMVDFFPSMKKKMHLIFGINMIK